MEISRLSDNLGGDMLVVPSPLVLWGGCDDPATVRGCFDINSWLLGLQNYPLSAAAEVAVSDLRGGTDAIQPGYNLRLALPVTLATRQKRTIISIGPSDLRSGVGPMGIESESKFITALIGDLNANVCLEIDPLPDLARDTELRAVSVSLLMIGGSHANRLARADNSGLPSFASGGWRAGRTAAETLASDLKDVKDTFPGNTVAVLQLFDNVAYYAVTSEDTIIPCRRDPLGKYHVDGDLLLAPPEMITPYIKNCGPVFELLADTPKIFLSPLPRYLTKSCCDDPEHGPNRKEDDFRRTIVSGTERLRKSIRDQLLTCGVRNFKVYNPLWLMAGPKATDEILQRCIDNLWMDDPVHPTDAGYKTLRDALYPLAKTLLDSSKGQRATSQPTRPGAWPEWIQARAPQPTLWSQRGGRGWRGQFRPPRGHPYAPVRERTRGRARGRGWPY